MKILQIISSFPPAYAYGGPPTSAYNLSKSLVERGHDVTVCTTDARDASSRVHIDENPTVVDGIEVRRFRNLSNTLSWKNYPLAPQMLPALFSIGEDFDVIHTHEYRSFHTLFAHLLSEHAGIPHVLQPRGSLPNRGGSALKSGFDTLVGERMIRSADRLIASSHTESKQYGQVASNLSEDKIHHVPNGISGDEYETLPPENSFRNAYGISQEESVVLFLSRLHPRKGGDLLIRALEEELTDGTTTLVLVGPDEGHRATLEGLVHDRGINDHVLFTGPLYDDDKIAAYADADVFALPSKDTYESFGNVAIEAMACGTPVVTTDVCGVSEWIDHEWCQSVPPTISALRQAITAVLSEAVEDGPSIRSYVHENFSWDTVAEQTEAVYAEVAQ